MLDNLIYIAMNSMTEMKGLYIYLMIRYVLVYHPIQIILESYRAFLGIVSIPGELLQSWGGTS